MRFFSFLLTVVILSSFQKASIDTLFWNGFQSENQSKINQSIEKIKAIENSIKKTAYLGGLEMKISQFEKNNGAKLKKFKAGKLKLETAIKQKPNSVAFRFIRFITQEKAPKVLKYNKQLTEDADFIKKNYTKASVSLKSMILAHSKKSDKLNI